jgi:DTW domain-containing protein YfiP
MGRSVVFSQLPRCSRCFHPLAWCLCAFDQSVALPCAVDVLMHHGETLRPSSTGHLVKRLVPDAGLHLFRPEGPPPVSEVVRPGRTVWILHPFGEELPLGPPPPDLQVVLVDGSWRQASVMLREMGGWGRKVRLPLTGTSRYWLRSQQGEGQFSTIEALLFLLESMGAGREAAQLRAQFELHVFAGLNVRGDKARITAFLATSPARALLEEAAARRLTLKRPA